MWNVNPKRYAKINTSMNSLNVVRIKEIVPFPTPWKTLPALAPNGTYKMNRHMICRKLAISGASSALLSEYENMNAICVENTFKIIHTIIEAIKATLTAYLATTLRFSYFLAPNATPATDIAAVPTPIAGSIPILTILHPAVYTATAVGPDTIVSM